MRRFFPLIAGVLLSTPGFAATLEDQIVVPKGVNYKKMDLAEETRVRSEVLAAFAAGEKSVAELFRGPCICGPAYWSMIKERTEIANVGATQGSFHVPNATTGHTQELKGATFLGEIRLQALAQSFAKDVGRSPTIRKLKENELTIYWSMTPFDIEEPVYVLEVGSKRFLFDLKKDQKTTAYCAFWIDELSTYYFSPR